jgi:hypothetical protein
MKKYRYQEGDIQGNIDSNSREKYIYFFLIRLFAIGFCLLGITLLSPILYKKNVYI